MRSTSDLRNDGQKLVSPYTFFGTTVHSVEPFGLIDWRNLKVYYFWGGVEGFPQVERVLDLASMVSTKLPRPKSMIKGDITKLESFMAREAFTRVEMEQYLPLTFSEDYKHSDASVEDGVICRTIDKLREIVTDTRIMNLQDRLKFIQSCFGPHAKIENNLILLGDHQAESAFSFREYVAREVAQVRAL